MSRRAYKQTTVPVAKSQEAIRQLLRNYNVIGCMFAEDWENNDIILKFVKRVDGTPRSVIIKLDPEDNEKQAYRYLHYWIKSQLEAIETNLVSFESAFLAHFEWMLEDGSMTTVGEIVTSRLGDQRPGYLLEAPEDDEVIEGRFEVGEV